VGGDEPEAALGLLDPAAAGPRTAAAVPRDLGEAYELVYAFIRNGGKLPMMARWIEGDSALR